MAGVFSRRRELGSSVRRGLATSMGLALVATLVTASPAPAAPPVAAPLVDEAPHPVQDDPPPVPSGGVPMLDYHPDLAEGATPMPADAAVASSAVDGATEDGATEDVLGPASVAAWPDAGRTEVAVPADGRARVGDLPVKVGRPTADGDRSAPDAVPAPERVTVEVLDRQDTAAAGVDGLLLRVGSPDGGASPGAQAKTQAKTQAGNQAGNQAGKVSLEVDYAKFRDRFGADWASRLRLVELPECAQGDPGKAGCGAWTPLPSENDPVAGQVTATVAANGGLVALAAAASGATGDYTATSLSPSASWQVSTQTGGFSWSYPIGVPPVPGGLTPTVSLDYASQDVDGRTAATNNQASWVGEGWSLWSGYVERSYAGCGDDMGGGSPKTGDLCWKTDNATMVLNGRATELVRDSATGVWRAKDDDGSKVERLTNASNGDDNGEYWRLTDTSGVQYYFGRNRLPGWTSGKPETRSAWTVPVFGNDSGEPCHTSTFNGSWCKQAWRWNLDYVVDPHGNAIVYYYTPEGNSYGRNVNKAVSEYTRGGTLAKIEYGLRSDAVYSTPAVGRVVFGVANRCVASSACTPSSPSDWPDTPWDQKCSGSSCPDQMAPTFWSTKHLASITTQIRVGSTYRNVDSWKLKHTFPKPGDGSDATLWLDSISHTGLTGAGTSVPDVEFDGEALHNRVDGVHDDLRPLNKYRVFAITSETGGVTGIHYATQCSRSSLPAPQSNTTLCFPVYWTPENQDRLLDWFHKYVVDQVVEVDTTGGAPFEVTSYQYLGSPAWHYNDNELVPADRRTWSQWRGYQRVRVLHGDPTMTTPSKSEYLYFRGMDGDTLPDNGTRHASVTDSEGTRTTDSDQLRGFLREEIHYNGSAVLSGTIYTPWTHGPTATRGSHQAFIVRASKTRTRTALSSGGFRRTEVDDTFDSHGIITSTSDLGDTSTSTDDRCTRHTYARNTGRWMLTYTSRVETVATSCASTPSFPGDAISDTRTSYDGGGFGAAPTKGDVTKTEELDTHPASGPTYVTTYHGTFDQYGRNLASFDALDHKTTTAYTPATGGPVTSVRTTNPLGHTTTTTLDPTRGLPVSTLDANRKRTDLAYDGLGRLTAVWLPGRSKARGTPDANLVFSYLVRKNGPVVVGTAKLMPSGGQLTSYTLYDSRLRPRQAQAPAPGGGRLVTDTFYDSRGLVVKANGAHFNTAAPTTTLLAAADNVIPSQTVTSYDNAERPVASIFRKLGVEQWRTTTSYGGDRVTVTPPAGGIPTTTISDARGNTTESRQYTSGTTSGPFQATHYTYTPAGQMASLTDPAGNTWHYTYDARGRKVADDDPDKGTSTYVYDDLGQLTSSTDARGQTLAYVYDALGRKVETHDDSPDGPLLANWVYDTVAKGQLTSSTRHEDGEEYTARVTGYDNGYRPTGSTISIPDSEGPLAGDYHTSTSYRVDGSVRSTTLPAAGRLPDETLEYEYNDVGIPDTLRGIDTYVTESIYSKYGQPLRYTLTAGGPKVWLSYYYEEGTRRLTRAITDRKTSSGATPSDVHYTYDPAGNITKIANTPPHLAADVQCFDYDHLRRLTQAWSSTNDCATGPSSSVVGGPAPYWQSFTYDAAGNRTTKVDHDPAGNTTSTYTYPAAGQFQPHGLESVAISGPSGNQRNTYDYDVVGNTTTRAIAGDTQHLAWGPSGHLTEVTDGEDTTSYVYDADGDRLLRRDATGTTVYINGMEVHADTSGKVTATRYYVHNGTLVATRTPEGLTWLTADHHGTADLAVDEATLDVTRRRFAPYGTRRGDEVDWPGERGFVNGVVDESTGLTHLGAREYDPSTGRFISVDPIFDPADPQQINGYTYADNNPVTNSDPTGKLCTNGPDGMCRTPSGKNIPTPGVSDRNSHPRRIHRAPRLVQHSYTGSNGFTMRRYRATRNVYFGNFRLPEDHPDDVALGQLAAYIDSVYLRPEYWGRTIPSMILEACDYAGGGGLCGSAFNGALTMANMNMPPAVDNCAVDQGICAAFEAEAATGLTGGLTGSEAFGKGRASTPDPDATFPYEKSAEAADTVLDNSGLVGGGLPANSYSDYFAVRHDPMTINGRGYNGSSLDAMQELGINAGDVEDIISSGDKYGGPTKGTATIYDSGRGMSVSIGRSTGTVVGVSPDACGGTC